MKNRVLYEYTANNICLKLKYEISLFITLCIHVHIYYRIQYTRKLRDHFSLKKKTIFKL